MEQFQGLLGIAAIVLLAWLTSSNRKAFSWRLVTVALGLQLVLALLLLKLPGIETVLHTINSAVLAVSDATKAGTGMVFGYLGGGEPPFSVENPGYMFVLAFEALPILIVFSAISALLWHWRVIPLVINGFAVLLKKTLKIDGVVGLGSASSIFVGMIESPLIIRPYLQTMSLSSLFVVMTCGMATVAGTVMALYATFLTPVLPQALGHILIASVLSVPSAIMIALVMMPGQDPGLEITIAPRSQSPYHGSMHALTEGTQQGLSLYLIVIAMLIVFVALVTLANMFLGIFVAELTIEKLFGYILSPFVWLLGVPWADSAIAGQLLSTKVVLNELIAFLHLSQQTGLEKKTVLIMSYTLCGFANFGSLGILIGGMIKLCPERSAEILKLAPKTIWSGVLATSMTGAIVGML
ncbi:MAG: nucleoside:proton symporter [Gammaproteobacteria bacterium]|nr:nucleoside:proton symporter [Gammaproteobacteria bacterium]